MVVNREFTYRGRIKVSRDDLVLAQSGKKTCTIRLGTAKVHDEVIDLSDGTTALQVRILSVETAPYRSLSLEHAMWEGFATVEDLRTDLEKYYRRIDPEQPVTIIRFTCAVP